MGRGGSASVAALTPRPAVPLRREEEEEVGIARCLFQPCWQGQGSAQVPPLSATLPSVTLLPLLLPPQTRERGRAVGAGRRLQLLPGSLCWAAMLWATPAAGKHFWRICPRRRGAGTRWPCHPPSLRSRAAMPPWKQSSSRSPGVLASGHPSPRSSGSITPQGQNANCPRASPSLRLGKSFLANKVQAPRG